MGQVNTNGLTLGVAWLVVHNGHDHSAVQMRRGGQFFQNQIGHSFINAGDTREFHIEMPAVSGSVFGEHLYINNIAVGIGGIEVPLTTPDGSTNIRFSRDYKYVINITGDHMITTGHGAMRAVVDIDNARRITIDDFAD